MRLPGTTPARVASSFTRIRLGASYSGPVSGPAPALPSSPPVGAFPPDGSLPSPPSTVLRPDPPSAHTRHIAFGSPSANTPFTYFAKRMRGLPRFRRPLCVHDVVFDPGAPRSARPCALTRCSLRLNWQSRQQQRSLISWPYTHPARSLSTLRASRYRYARKTRYGASG